MKIAWSFLVILVLAASPVAADITAVIVDLDGEISISRDGEFLDEWDIDYGTELESYDIIHTGPDGYLELSIESPVSSQLSMKVLENTTLFLEHAVQSGKAETSATLHRGAVQTRAAALIQGNNFNIKTETSVMGIRGTTFTVTQSPDTSILVSCREGEVSCTTSDRNSNIMPGKIYETNPSGQFRVQPLPVDKIDLYTEKWQQARLDALKINGALALEQYASLYNQALPRFQDAWTALEVQQKTFDKWEKIMKEGKSVSMGDAVQDKTAVSKGIIALRASLPMMKHSYFILYDLLKIMEESSWKGLSDNTLNTVAHYKRTQQEYFEKIARVQYYFKIYLEMDRQSSPFPEDEGGSLLDDFLMNSGF
ncbi:MAG: FecR family protein [Spirochaetales bacterium]|nr:FecR family protein [Spirochaetales bacterium]